MSILNRTDRFVVRQQDHGNGKIGRWVYYQCPRCDYVHSLPIDYPQSNGARWTWNGNMEKPTLKPSVMSPGGGAMCHHFVTDGILHFLNDTSPNPRTGEPFAGVSVEMPELPKHIKGE